MGKDNRELDGISESILKCAYQVSNTLGAGFLEKVYENALTIELRANGMHVEQQKEFQVLYANQVVGQYVADMVVGGRIIVELKAIKALDEVHVAQCLNYLKAARLRLCLLLNFGTPKVEIRRIIHGYA